MKRRTLLKSGLAGMLYAALPTPMLRAQDRVRLTTGTRTIDVNGKAATVFGLTGPDGRPGLVLDQEAGFHVDLVNGLAEDTLIHWHGLTPPFAQDGVPDNPAPMLKPGETRAYDFDLAYSGTNWMHAHTLQEQAMLAAPLIIRSRQDRAADEQEVTLFLHDFSFRSPDELLADLTGGKSGNGGMSMDHSQMNHGGMSMNGMSMQGMDMGGMFMDINDIYYDAYLANDRTLDDPEVITVEKGGRIRLRVINAATSTAFSLDLGALSAELIAVDGQAIKPIKASLVPLTMAQRADVRITIPVEGGTFPILALREGAPERTGIVLATKGAAIERLSVKGEASGPRLDLAFEAGLSALDPLTDKQARQSSISLVGNMMSYRWGLEGADNLGASMGERLEFVLTNHSMMAHPMHLHGHHFQVVAINGNRFSGAMRDTVLVPPMQQVTIAFDADNPGRWAFHCHHLYHMVTGMMTFLAYDTI